MPPRESSRRCGGLRLDSCDGVCPHCRVNFHCKARAMAHLENGARCCSEALMGATWWSSRRRGSKMRIMSCTAGRRVWKVPTYPDVELLAEAT